MRRLTILILSIISSSILFAQDYREVQGRVIDQDGHPVADARVVCNAECVCVTGADGLFNFRTTIYSRDIEVNVAGFITRRVDIDGSFLTVRLQKDLTYYVKLAAKQKAEEKARIAAEKDARSAEEKRIAEETARIKAEEKARIAAEKDARSAEEKRIAEEEARIKAEEKAKLTAERKAKQLQLTEAYNKKYRNKGFVHSLECSYLPQPNVSGHVIYTNLGHRDYGNLHPVQLDYLFGYRFNNSFMLNLGVGILVHTVNLTACGDTFIYGNVDYRPFDIPVFANFRATLTRGKVQPIVVVSAGVYTLSPTFLIEVGVGVNYRISKRSNVYFTLSANSTPWVSIDYPYCNEFTVFSPGFKIGFTL